MFSRKLKTTIFAVMTMVAILTILLSVCITAPFSYAESEEKENILRAEYITGNYYNFGEILDISSSENGFSTLELIEEKLYLRVIGESEPIPLENTASENFSKAEIVSFSEKIFVKQDDGIYVYVIGESKELVKYLDLTYSYTVDDEPAIGAFKSFGGANTDKVLIVDYTSIILFFDISKNAEQSIEEKRINSLTVTSKNSFDKMVVENDEQNKINLHLYDSKTGNKFTKLCERNEKGKYTADEERTQNALDVFPKKDLFSTFNGGLVLKTDGLYAGKTKAIVINSEEESSIVSDSIIQEFSRMSVGGDKLFIADNKQKAVKVYDKSYALVELYGAEGNGVSDNQKGLTRFRNPKFLANEKDYLALYDEGNSRIVLLDDEGNALNQTSVGKVNGLTILDGVWFVEDNKVVKLDYNMEIQAEIPSEDTLSTIITDKTNVFVKGQDGVYKVKGAKLELLDNISANAIYGGKHDGVIYSVDDNSFSMLKDGKEIISCEKQPHSVFAIDYQGNVIYGKDKSITLLTRKLDGFDKVSYATEINVKELVITNKGNVFALSEHALVKVDYLAVSSETVFEKPEKTYPYKSIEVTSPIFGYTRPDNYESVVEIESGSFILFAVSVYEGNNFYFTELLRDGKYIDLYIPEKSAVVSENVIEQNKYIKYGGTDANPNAYAYPSNSATPICNIDKDASYQVIRLISNDWNWYELEIDGKRCYVNARNYITAEPPYITVERYYMRAKADSFGNTIPLFSSPDASSQIIANVGEGYMLELTEPYNKDNEFLQVRYNKGIAYVKTQNIQKDGLTEGQKFALIFAGVVIGITAILGILSLIVRRRKFEQ